MVWTKITQQQYRRDDLRYASDMRVSMALAGFVDAAAVSGWTPARG